MMKKNSKLAKIPKWPKIVKEPLTTFRPVSSDASQDFKIPRHVAHDLYNRGEILMDTTNGGYCPHPKSTYNVRQHKVKG